VLGGYAPFAPRFILELLKKGNLIRFGHELAALFAHPERERLLREFRSLLSPAASRQSAERTAATALKNKFGISFDWVEIEQPRYAGIKDFLHGWIYQYSLPRLLVCNDKMSMANSVEGRAPFLDHEFVDMAFSMDTRDLMVNGLRKFPLREAMQGLVPDEILLRKSKDAFNAPIFEYLRSESLQRRVKEVFRDPRTAAVFSPRAYLAEYERFLARRGADRPFLLHGLFLEEWARTFDVDFV
jgi:hypothetical protein